MEPVDEDIFFLLNRFRLVSYVTKFADFTRHRNDNQRMVVTPDTSIESLRITSKHRSEFNLIISESRWYFPPLGFCLDWGMEEGMENENRKSVKTKIKQNFEQPNAESLLIDSNNSKQGRQHFCIALLLMNKHNFNTYPIRTLNTQRLFGIKIIENEDSE